MGADESIPRQVWTVGWIVVLGTLGSIFSLSSVNVAFYVLGRELDATLDTVQWVATGYLLGMATVVSTTGWLLRRVGARRLYLWTLALFVATSMLCSLATTIDQLIVFRVMQGIAGGASLPIGQMILVSVAGPAQMGRVMSVIGVPMLFGPVLGPVIGGLLIEELSWHALFLMNVPLGLAAFALGVSKLPSLPPEPAGRFDWRGFVLIALGAPALVYGLAQAGRAAALESRSLIPVAAGCALLAVFVWHARRVAYPLVDVRLWRSPTFASCAVAALFVNATLFGLLIVLPLYFQVARGEDAASTGLLLLPQGVAGALSMIVAGRLTDRIGGGRTAVAGIAIVMLATFALVFVGPTTPYWMLCTLLLVRGLGIGGALMPVMAAAYTTLSPRQVSDATPQLNMLQRLGNAIGGAIMAMVLTSRLQEAGSDAASVASAFGATFAVATALTAMALVPAVALAIIDRRRALKAPSAVIVEAEASVI
jgi:EmrB/QacA subfamily drug resistance transporter